jgi:hypothetical protein
MLQGTWRIVAVMAAVAVWLVFGVFLRRTERAAAPPAGMPAVLAPPGAVENFLEGSQPPMPPRARPAPRYTPAEQENDSDSAESELEDDDVDLTPGTLLPTATAPPQEQPPPPAAETKATQPPPVRGGGSGGGSAGLTLFPLDNLGGLNLIEKSRVPPVVTKAGKRAFEVVYKRGEIHPKGTNSNFMFGPKQFFPSTQARFAFKLYVDDAWPWNTGSDGQEKIGGKLLGFDIGKGSASGGNYSKTGSSYRLTFAENGGIGPYLYPQVRQPRSHRDPASEKDIDQVAEFWDIGRLTAGGTHMFYPKGNRKGKPWTLQIKKGQWNDMEMFMKLNTPGKYDGVIEATINGATVRFDKVRYRYDEAKINGIQMGTFFGGGTKAYAPSRDLKTWWADFSFAAS